MLGTLLLFGIFLALPFPAHAISWLGLGDIAASAAGQLLGAFSYIVGFVGGLFLNFFAWLVGIMIDMNKQVFDEQNTILHEGWRVTRDLANLGFVLVIIIIAFGVMFRVEKYGSQKLLVRLIAAAILVNFSLAIAGAFLQFSNVLAAFFLNRIPSPMGLGAALQGAFNPQRFASPENFNTTLEGLSTFGTALLTTIAQNLFAIVFTFISIVVVATFGIILFVRYLHLTFLGIIAPIVWLFWVIPDLSGYFKEWWNAFIKWTFFAPAATFFLYLGFYEVEMIGKRKALIATGSNFFEAGLISVMSQGIQMFLIAGIMLGGLIVAQKIGIKSAEIVMNFANKAKKGAQVWAGRKAAQAASRPLRGETGRKVTAWMQKTPLLKTAGTFLANQRLGFEKKAAEDAKKGLPKDLKEQALQYGSVTTTNAGRVQIMDNLVKERKTRSKKLRTEQEKLSNLDSQTAQKAEEVAKKDASIEELRGKRDESQRMGGTFTQELTVQLETEIRARETLVKDRDDIAKKREELTTDPQSSYNQALKAKQDIDAAVASLPKNAREALTSAGYEVNKTKLHTLYGKKGGVIPTEGKVEKVEKLFKEITEEEGGGEEKKDEGEKKT